MYIYRPCIYKPKHLLRVCDQEALSSILVPPSPINCAIVQEIYLYFLKNIFTATKLIEISPFEDEVLTFTKKWVKYKRIYMVETHDYIN